MTRIGYACKVLGVPGTQIKGCLMANADKDRLTHLISENLKALKRMIDYNIENDIRLFRISSDIIPFGSSPVNALIWWEQFDALFRGIGIKIRESGMRVSMHPGQYTVLNSPDPGVVERAIQDLIYHTRLLDCLRTGRESKIILHIGGVYGNKPQSIERFIHHYDQLPDSVKRRLVIENDDKSYTIREVLQIGQRLIIPVVFDNLHHQVNPPDKNRPENFWINECRHTWKKEDGSQKIHYAQQHTGKRAGAHSDRIQIQPFLAFYQLLEHKDIDIMLEVKDKNLSAIKCIHSLSNRQ